MLLLVNIGVVMSLSKPRILPQTLYDAHAVICVFWNDGVVVDPASGVIEDRSASMMSWLLWSCDC